MSLIFEILEFSQHSGFPPGIVRILRIIDRQRHSKCRQECLFHLLFQEFVCPPWFMHQLQLLINFSSRSTIMSTRRSPRKKPRKTPKASFLWTTAQRWCVIHWMKENSKYYNNKNIVNSKKYARILEALPGKDF